MMDARKGFTLLEVTIASAIMVIVLAAVCTFFVGIHRLIYHAYYVSRSSLDLRAEREHLLFHTYHEGGNAYWAGALSAWHRIAATPGTDAADDSSGSLSFDVLGLDTGARRPRFGERTVTYPPAASQKLTTAVVGSSLDTGTTLKGRNLPILIPVTLRRKIGNSASITEMHKERVVIPVLGAAQVWDANENANVFHDTEGVSK